ncbi:class I SAM-dependent methyltransferase [Algoriphagus sp. NG3]|uniref:class I SAM-dependent methyltransferase n=1 Tax=Algoriphagus sp. NG3 TaxID=3097546 RepID=UPI002A801291|nr:class I SAM-dependent methyltransferase [Algoriphagus sp. NG3]WPR77790.1 class I SAM-dependent methyltransferase [Algoriphagus sp. NG3]
MYPIFYYWFKGQYINEIMDFKKKVYSFSSDEYSYFYKKISNRADDRPTDMNMESIDHIIKNLDVNQNTLLDVGCGRGFLLSQIRQKKNFDLTGCEIHNGLKDSDIKFKSGFVEQLPFPDKSFDIVICTHTIEHIIDLEKALTELKRVAKKQLIIVTPRQKYYYYTLDLHVNFFPIAESLCNQIGIENYSCKDIGGDWVYVAELAD